MSGEVLTGFREVFHVVVKEAALIIYAYAFIYACKEGNFAFGILISDRVCMQNAVG